MKKDFTQILMTLGFGVACLGLIIGTANLFGAGYYSMSDLLASSFLTIGNLALFIAYPFVFSKNSVVKNCGYGLAFLLGLNNVVFLGFEAGVTVSAVGALIMAISSLLYFVLLICKFFGIGRTKNADKDDLLETINTYHDLLKEGVITKEEFDKIKEGLFGNNHKTTTVENLKSWKKLLDQKIITDAEFSKVKADALKK